MLMLLQNKSNDIAFAKQGCSTKCLCSFLINLGMMIVTSEVYLQPLVKGGMARGQWHNLHKFSFLYLQICCPWAHLQLDRKVLWVHTTDWGYLSLFKQGRGTSGVCALYTKDWSTFLIQLPYYHQPTLLQKSHQIKSLLWCLCHRWLSSLFL